MAPTLLDVSGQLSFCLGDKMRLSPRVLAIFVFAMGLGAGVAITAEVRDRLLVGVPRTEVYEALYRDGLAAQYTFVGWLLSLVLSAALAKATGLCSRRWLA